MHRSKKKHVLHLPHFEVRCRSASVYLSLAGIHEFEYEGLEGE